MFRHILLFVAVISGMHFILSQPAHCDSLISPTVDKVVIINNQEGILASFEIKNAFPTSKEIDDSIKSGIPTSFTFFIEIYRKKGLWFDETLADMKFKHTIKYDTLKEEYEILQDENPQNIIRVKDISEAKKIMAYVENVIVKPVSIFIKGEEYHIKIKAALDPANLPFPLNYMLFFVSFWDYETGWYEKEFILQ